MTTKLLVFIGIGLGFFQFSYAEEVCVTNGRELAAHKDDFPRFFHTKHEVRFARSESPIAYFNFQVTEEKIFGEAKYKLPIFGIKTAKGYATNLCYDKDSREIKIKLDNGSDFTVKVVNDNPPEATVTIKGYTLTRKAEEYDKAMALLNSTSSKPTYHNNSSSGEGGAE